MEEDQVPDASYAFGVSCLLLNGLVVSMVSLVCRRAVGSGSFGEF